MTFAEWEAEQATVMVWPDSADAYREFMAIQTQWRMGFGGPIGLDYNVLYHRLDRLNLSPERREELEQEITVIERAAIDAHYE